MTRNKAVAFAGLLAVAVLGYIALGPFITLHEIKVSLEGQDSEKLAAYIDFPKLRANLKEQLNAVAMREAATELRDNPFGALGVALASKLVDGMIDSFVTPSGLANLAAGSKPRQAVRAEQTAVSESSKDTSAPEQPPQPFNDAHYSYDSLSNFSVWVGGPGSDRVRFVLSREGLSWKLTNVIVPTGELESRGVLGAFTGAPTGGPSSSSQANLLKIENVDSRVTESNDVWARYAWKLSISNAGDEAATFDVMIKWEDKDGFVIDDTREYGLSLAPHETRSFTGDDLINYPAASRVDKIEASLSQ